MKAVIWKVPAVDLKQDTKTDKLVEKKEDGGREEVLPDITMGDGQK